jgi:hypothetical protein
MGLVLCAAIASTPGRASAQAAEDLGVHLRLETQWDSSLGQGQWQAYLDIHDASSQPRTLGLDAILFNVLGLDGVTIHDDARVDLPIEYDGTFQRGFYEEPFRSDGQRLGTTSWGDIAGAQPLVVQENPDNAGVLNVLVGQGIENSVPLGSGSWGYTDGADSGSLLLESSANFVTLLPSTLPEPGMDVQRIGPDYVRKNLVLVGQQEQASVSYDGLLGVGSDSTLHAGTLEAAALDLQGTALVDDLLLTGDGYVGPDGSLSVLGASVSGTMVVDGELVIDPDSLTSTSLSGLSIGPSGRVVLADDPFLPLPTSTVTNDSSTVLIPEPATLALFCVGGGVLLRRRRRD